MDRSLSVFDASLDLLAARRRVVAHNVANLETPGFVARRLDFEGLLGAAIGRGGTQTVTVPVGRSSEPAWLNGNNVILEDETRILQETELHYQAVVEAVKNQFALIRSAVA